MDPNDRANGGPHRHYRFNDNPPTPPPSVISDQSDIGTLVDSVGSWQIEINVDVSVRDVLANNEISELEPFPDSPNPMCKILYLVTVGRAIGAFSTWEECSWCTSSYSNTVHHKYRSWDDARDVWIRANLERRTTGPLHPNSLFPRVISQQEVERRISREREHRQTEQLRLQMDAIRRAATAMAYNGLVHGSLPDVPQPFTSFVSRRPAAQRFTVPTTNAPFLPAAAKHQDVATTSALDLPSDPRSTTLSAAAHAPSRPTVVIPRTYDEPYETQFRDEVFPDIDEHPAWSPSTSESKAEATRGPVVVVPRTYDEPYETQFRDEFFPDIKEFWPLSASRSKSKATRGPVVVVPRTYDEPYETQFRDEVLPDIDAPPPATSRGRGISVSVSSVTTVSESVSEPSPPSTPADAPQAAAKGKGPANGLGPRERAALLDIQMNPVPPPAAYVVIRGIEPGIYRTRDDCVAARGHHPRVWYRACDTEELAEAIFAKLGGFVEYLDPN